MPGWHAKTEDLVDSGKLKVVGIVQEQHPDRAVLYMQWQKMSWPVLADPFNQLGIKVVPITLLIDEHGIIRFRNPKAKDLTTFLETSYSDDVAPAVKAFDWPRLDIMNLEKVRKRSPENAVAHFRLGVAYRQRFDSSERQPGDFKQSVTFWKKALALDPAQYIWRRRIQQYGPRLDKPYSFYDWVHQARVEITARGEKPHALITEPRGSEFAHPGKGDAMAEQVHPDPEGRVTRDTDFLVDARVVIVPSTKGDGKALRVHLHFLPDAKKKVHWTNDAGELSFFIAEGQDVVIHDQSISAPPKDKELSSEERVVEYEIRPAKGKTLPKILKGAAFYFVCEDENGTCLYLRQDLEIEL